MRLNDSRLVTTFFTFLKASLRAAACGGRPRAGSDAAATAPANPRAKWSASCGLTCQSRPSMLS
jgi:hypothetical protein